MPSSSTINRPAGGLNPHDTPSPTNASNPDTLRPRVGTTPTSNHLVSARPPNLPSPRLPTEIEKPRHGLPIRTLRAVAGPRLRTEPLATSVPSRGPAPTSRSDVPGSKSNTSKEDAPSGLFDPPTANRASRGDPSSRSNQGSGLTGKTPSRPLGNLTGRPLSSRLPSTSRKRPFDAIDSDSDVDDKENATSPKVAPEEKEKVSLRPAKRARFGLVQNVCKPPAQHESRPVETAPRKPEGTPYASSTGLKALKDGRIVPKDDAVPSRTAKSALSPNAEGRKTRPASGSCPPPIVARRTTALPGSRIEVPVGAKEDLRELHLCHRPTSEEAEGYAKAQRKSTTRVHESPARALAGAAQPQERRPALKDRANQSLPDGQGSGTSADDAKDLHPGCQANQISFETRDDQTDDEDDGDASPLEHQGPVIGAPSPAVPCAAETSISTKPDSASNPIPSPDKGPSPPGPASRSSNRTRPPPPTNGDQQCLWVMGYTFCQDTFKDGEDLMAHIISEHLTSPANPYSDGGRYRICCNYFKENGENGECGSILDPHSFRRHLKEDHRVKSIDLTWEMSCCGKRIPYGGVIKHFKVCDLFPAHLKDMWPKTKTGELMEKVKGRKPARELIKYKAAFFRYFGMHNIPQ